MWEFESSRAASWRPSPRGRRSTGTDLSRSRPARPAWHQREEHPPAAGPGAAAAAPQALFAEGDAAVGVVRRVGPAGATVALYNASTSAAVAARSEGDGAPEGLVHTKDLFEDLFPGSVIPVYVLRVRGDGAIGTWRANLRLWRSLSASVAWFLTRTLTSPDLTLRPYGKKAADDCKRQLKRALIAHGGWLPYDNSTPPPVLRQEFNMSKSQFKRALGALLRQGSAALAEEGGITYVPKRERPQRPVSRRQRRLRGVQASVLEFQRASRQREDKASSRMPRIQLPEGFSIEDDAWSDGEEASATGVPPPPPPPLKADRRAEAAATDDSGYSADEEGWDSMTDATTDDSEAEARA